MKLTQNDIYVVRSDVLLGDTDNKVLTYLYQPLIGAISTGIYRTLWEELDHYKLQGNKRNIFRLMSTVRVSEDELYDGLKKIEALGLLRTYLKEKDGIRYIVFDLISPLTPERYLSNEVFTTFLKGELGEEYFNETLNLFQRKRFNKKQFLEISHSFSDIYGIIQTEEVSVIPSDFIGNKEINKQVLNNKFSPQKFLGLAEKVYIPGEIMTETVLESISNIAFVYNYTEREMVRFVLGAVENQTIDIGALRSLARDAYLLKKSDKGPIIIENKVQEEKDEESPVGLELTHSSLSPYDYFRRFFRGGNPPAVDLKVIEEVMMDIKLTPEVMNVLISYIMYSREGKFDRRYVHKIAGQWKRLGITTVKQAMEHAKLEYGKKKQYEKKQEDRVRREGVEQIPDFEDPEQDMTDEELAKHAEEIKRMLED